MGITNCFHAGKSTENHSETHAVSIPLTLIKLGNRFSIKVTSGASLRLTDCNLAKDESAKY